MTVNLNGNELEIAEKTNAGIVPLKENRGSFQAIEEFTKLISQAPDKDGVKKTPDGNAETLVISYIESKLDEIYLRQWGASDVHVQQIGNEILVWLTLWVIDPQTKMKIERPGFAAVVITVDAVPDSLKWNQSDPQNVQNEKKRERNQWALDMSNKKPNAMYLSFPKAKSMAIKNAAQSLGVIFGRNLNRKFEDTPESFYTNEFEARETIEQVSEALEGCTTVEELIAIWNGYPELQSNATFKRNFSYYRSKLQKK